ncbi:hypothetical protein [Saccharicrinis sp. FJH54]|uniref:hypothetical protein n=1 Tax=Saccharicrinis sp. FJH54 TaxID=3344665 RepID=UPI0035D41071
MSCKPEIQNNHEQRNVQRYAAILFAVICLFSFNSCSIYSPSVSSPVLVKNKGDKQTDISITTSDQLGSGVGFSFSKAYGLKDNTALRFTVTKELGGKNELDFTLGKYTVLSPKTRFGLFPGLSGGFINYTDMTGDIKNADWERWSGHYFSPYLRLQFLAEFDFMTVGAGTTIRYFIPDFYRDDERFNQTGFAIEPSLFIMPTYAKRRTHLTLNCAYSDFHPVGRLHPGYNYYSDHYFNKLVFSIGINYYISSRE